MSRARFKGRPDAALEELAHRLLPVAAEGAAIARDAVVDVIESSTPAGRLYRTRDGRAYRASAPGQPPASPTGVYPASWGTTRPEIRGGNPRCAAATDSGIGPALEFGEPGPPPIEPRPHARPGAMLAADRIAARLSELRR